MKMLDLVKDLRLCHTEGCPSLPLYGGVSVRLILSCWQSLLAILPPARLRMQNQPRQHQTKSAELCLRSVRSVDPKAGKQGQKVSPRSSVVILRDALLRLVGNPAKSVAACRHRFSAFNAGGTISAQGQILRSSQFGKRRCRFDLHGIQWDVLRCKDADQNPECTGCGMVLSLARQIVRYCCATNRRAATERQLSWVVSHFDCNRSCEP